MPPYFLLEHIMKDYRIKTILTLPEDQQEEYMDFFRWVKGVPVIRIGWWKIKARGIKALRYDEAAKKIRSCNFIEAIQLLYGWEIWYVPKKLRDGTRPKRICINVPRWVVINMRASQIYPAVNWIRQQVKEIEIEENNIYSLLPPDSDMAAIDRGELKKFGIANVLKGIGKSLNKTAEEIAGWTFGRVMMEVEMDVISAVHSKLYAKRMIEKNKKG